MSTTVVLQPDSAQDMPVDSHSLATVISHLSTPSNKAARDDLDDLKFQNEATELTTIMPQKLASVYITVCILCMCVAFGGFVSG